MIRDNDDQLLRAGDAPRRLSRRYSFLAIAWDAADLPSLVGHLLVTSPRAEINQAVLPKSAYGLRERHDAFVALEAAVVLHSAHSRELGMLPVVVLPSWNASLAGLEDGV